jgi:hypothetical protein
MLSIICRNKKNSILSGRLKIAPKKGKIKRMLSMRYRLLSVAKDSLVYAQCKLNILYRMLSILCRNKKNSILSGRLKIAPKKGKIKCMLSMPYRLLSICSACAT